MYPYPLNISIATVNLLKNVILLQYLKNRHKVVLKKDWMHYVSENSKVFCFVL